MGLHDRLKTSNGAGSATAEALLSGSPTHESSHDPAAHDPYAELKTRIHHACIATLGAELFKREATGDLNERVTRAVTEQLMLDRTPLTREERRQIIREITDDILGYGPLENFLRDDSVTEVMVNAYDRIYVERLGKIERTQAAFADNSHLLRIIDKIVSQIGRHVDEASPMVDARLPDGSRVNCIIPPLCLDGPSVSIRKFSKVPFTADDLVRFGTVTQKAMVFLEAAVKSGLNILVAGGTSSGKTTFLNVLSSYIPHEERIITIEDAAELQLQQIHVLRLESRPANIEGAGQISIRDLVVNSLRMRPDRIIVGECRSKEALDMLQAMNTGHDGCMTTIHSNGPRDTLSRVETMVLMAGTELPLRAIREQVASAFDLVVYMERLEDGARKVTSISEILGMEEETVLMQSIFQYEPHERDGRTLYDLRPQGLRPIVMRKIERANHYL